MFEDLAYHSYVWYGMVWYYIDFFYYIHYQLPTVIDIP
jgi:hypothetical protein